MFTGIVTHRGQLMRCTPSSADDQLMQLVVQPEQPITGLAIGDSVALDGCCLTVVAFEDDGLAFDAVPETLRKTTLGDRVVGDRVHMEAALRTGDALGGHWVQGHVDGVGHVRAVERRGEDVRLVVGLPAALEGDVLPKGSITVDGVSLTAGEVWREDDEERFSLYLIPHTLKVTGLGARSPGDLVNLEADVLGRWVKHHLERAASPR
jgi:riboflavin synthase